MKHLLLMLCMLLLLLPLAAEVVGKIYFVSGTVEYKENLNAPFKVATRNMQVHMDGYLKTGLAAKAEINFDNGARAVVEQNKNTGIRLLLEEANAQGGWSDKVKRQIKNLSLPQNRESSAVAGIRRTEAQAEKKSDYFWEIEEAADLQTAMSFYDQGKYTEAIPLLAKVIEQGPLLEDAEISHLLLAMIYEEQQNPIARDKHLSTLRKDFPHSQFLDNLPGK